MKTNLTITLLLWTSLIMAQEIPKEAQHTFNQEKREYKELAREGYDIILDPIEQTPIDPSMYKIAPTYTGNWGNEYLGITVLFNQIKAKATKKVVVYIFDTAGEFDHPLLKAAAWNEKGRIYTSESSKLDGNGHGTHCAGIIAGTSPSVPLGIARGLVEKGLLKVVPIKVLTNQGAGSFTWVINAVKDVNIEAVQLIQQGWSVVYSFSLGGNVPSGIPELETVFKYAVDQGVFIAAASGNTGGEGVNYPGSSPNARAVAALERLDETNARRASYSTTGTQVYCAAPGSNVLSTYLNGTLRELSGTSMATPHVAGVAAILLSCNPSANGVGVANHMAKYSIDLPPTGRDKETGFGAVRMPALFNNPIGGTPPPPPVDPPPPPTPIDPVKPTIWTASIGMPPGDVFYQVWKTQGQTKSQALKVKILRVEVRSKLYGEPLYDKVQVAISQYFQNSMMVVRDVDDYVTTTAWVAVFLEYFVNDKLKSDGITIKVMDLDGEDIMARYCSHRNVVRPLATANEQIPNIVGISNFLRNKLLKQANLKKQR